MTPRGRRGLVKPLQFGDCVWGIAHAGRASIAFDAIHVWELINVLSWEEGCQFTFLAAISFTFVEANGLITPVWIGRGQVVRPFGVDIPGIRSRRESQEDRKVRDGRQEKVLSHDWDQARQ